MKDNPKPWTDKEDALLINLRSQNVISVEIAKRINLQFHTGRTKRAVIARAMRIGCVQFSIDDKKQMQPKFHNDGKYTKPFVIPVNAGEGITIHELTNVTCRYPSNDEKRLYCGKQVTYKSYCACHAKACYAGTPEIKLPSV